MDIINIDISDKLSFCKDRNLDHDLRKMTLLNSLSADEVIRWVEQCIF